MDIATLNQLDSGVLKLLVVIAGTLIVLITTLVVYLIRRDIDKSDKQKELTDESIADLKDFLNSLTNKLAIMETRNQTFIDGCTNHHAIVNKRFDSHSKRLDTHGEKISEHETEIKILKRLRDAE